MAAIAEFYSMNLAAEVHKGMRQKVLVEVGRTKHPVGTTPCMTRLAEVRSRSIQLTVRSSVELSTSSVRRAFPCA